MYRVWIKEQENQCIHDRRKNPLLSLPSNDDNKVAHEKVTISHLTPYV